MMLLKDAWESISFFTVAVCWAHSHCLSAVTTTELQSKFCDYTKEVNLNLLMKCAARYTGTLLHGGCFRS